MFRSVIIGPDRGLNTRLSEALEATGYVAVNRSIESYPNGVELLRALRASAAEILFLDFINLERTREIVEAIEAEGLSLPVVAIHRQVSAEALRETMRLGVRESLWEPFEEAAIMESLSHIKTFLERRPAQYDVQSQLFCFLPSKAGVGTSTIALNVSAALARRPDTSCLLSDFDLNSGMIRFLLQLQNSFCVTDAVERSLEMDENLWPQLVTRINGLDVLHAGSINPNYRIDPSRLQTLLEFLRRNYKVLCADLSGNLERYSLELMHEAKMVVLVCTPEVPSIHLAREKLMFLKSIDLTNRIGVVLNRVHKKPLFSTKQVEELLGVPVLQVFANDYHGVNRAVNTATTLTPNSEMGKQFSHFAASLIDAKVEPHESKHRFLEFLTVPSRPAV
ncbi:MAG: hypothetical protein ABL995_16655 [Bryobacteraceae bacterium]